MQKHFWYSIRWNTIDTLYYNSMLLAHYTALFWVADTATYGLIGTLFSVLYLITKGSNCGLDYSLAPFFARAARSKRLFWQIVGRQVVLHQLFLLVVALLLWWGHEWLLAGRNMLTSLSAVRHGWYGLLFGALVVGESSKKTLRTLGQLCFRNRRVAITEAIGITLYTSLFWGLYWFGCPINAALAFGPLLASSLVCNVLLAHGVWQWFRQLPQVEVGDQPINNLTGRIATSRFFTHMNQCANLLFSSNAIIPLFAYQFDLNHAGIITMLSYGTYCVTTIMTHIFGATASACFSIDHPDKHRVLSYLTKAIVFTLCAALAVGLFACGCLWLWHNEQTFSIPLSLCAVGILYYVLQYVLIPYEHWYIVNEKPHYIVVLNSINILCVYAALAGWLPFATSTTCTLVMLARLLTFAGAIALFLYHWHPARAKATAKPV